MKVNRFGILGLALVTAFGMTACDEGTVTPPPPITVQVVPPSASLEVGQTIGLVAVVQNAANQNVTWTSASPGVASVNTQGVVTAVTPGTAVITAASQQDPNARGASAIVVVAAAPPPPISVNVQPQQASVQVGGSVSLVAQVIGSTNQTVTWESAAPAIATVNATTGVVSGLAPGQAVIRARSAADPTVTGLATVTVTAEAVPTVIVVPNQATLYPQETITLSAVVQGHTNQAVTWSSATPGVATVSTTGVVTAVAPGTALIRATSVANPNAIGVAQIVVEQRPGGNVSIERVTTLAGVTVDPSNVTGIVNVVTTINAPVGSGVTAVRLIAVCPNGEREIGRQAVSAGTTGQIVFTWNTAQFDPATGEPYYMSGVCQLRAELVTAQGAVTASATAGPYILTNVNTVALSMTTVGVTSPGSVFVGGVEWREGNVVVTAAPVLFTGGTVSSVTICVQAVDGLQTAPACRAGVLNGGVFTATFPKANAFNAGAAVGGPGVAGINTNQLHAYATTMLSTGAAGPAIAFGAGPNIRLDNVAPSAPTVALPRAWLNGAFAFNAANVVTVAAVDPVPGVGLEGYEFRYILESAWAARTSDLAGWNAATPVTSAADIPASDVSTHYRLIVRARDRLGNLSPIVWTGTFGVDLQAPTFTIVAGSPANMLINPGTQFSFTFTDDRAGFDANPVQVRIIRYRRLAPATACVDVNTQAVTTVPAAGCPWVTLTAPGNMFSVPADDGYYDVAVRVVDRAMNMSAVQERVYLRDVTAPTVGISSFAVAGNDITINAALTDNVDLRGYDWRMAFAGAAAPTGAPDATLPITMMEQIGSFGHASRTGTFNVSGTVTVWRSLYVTAANGDIAGGSQHNTTGVAVGAWDVARNFGANGVGVGPAGGAVPTGLSNWNITRTPAALCNGWTPIPSGDAGANCASPPQPSTSTITATAVGPTGTFVNPFATVYFYAVYPAGPASSPNVVLLGSVTGASAQVIEQTAPTVNRLYRWTFTFDASQRPQGTYNVFAVGFSAVRDAFRSPDLAITVAGAAQLPTTLSDRP
jgi:uncharacterized protein YjdB